MKLRIRSLFYHLICLSLLQVWTSAKEVFPDIYTDPENVQKLLNNSRLHKNRLVFREGEKKYGNEKTNKNCRADMKSWMGSLSTVKELGKCDRSEANCTATLKLLNSYARFPSSNHPNIYEGSYEQCLSLNNENSLSFETKYCYLIHWDQKNKSCQEDSYSVLLKPNRTAFAICGPKSCQGKDYQVMFDNLQKPFDFMIDRPVCAAFCANRDIPQSKTYFIVTSFIILVVFLVCSATLWDYMKDKKYKIVADQDDVPCTVISLICALLSSGSLIFFYWKHDYLKPAFIGNHELDDHLVEIILSKPWNQMAPYMYGMISGYVLANYRGKSFSFHPFPVTIIWIIAITLGILTIISSNFWDDCVKDCWLRNASINLTTRFVWTICLAWIIVATHLKWAGPLTNFLEHPFWRPFGRLSFCAFITHYIIIYYVFNLDEQAPFFVSFWYNFFHFILPISTFSFVTAAFLSLLIELPMMRMDKLLYERFLPSPHHDEADEKNEEKEPTLDEDYGDEDVDVEEKVQENDEGPLLNHEF
uniref:NRF domain-containing protein n=2 Tax=Caenorhabditis japonica TaxID=281687 RepID=A0A8R1HN61_CAEJA